MDEINRRLAEAVTGMDAEETRRLARLVIDEGLSPISAIENGLAVGMTEVGRLFVAGEIFVPEVLVAAQAMYAGFNLLKEKVPVIALASKGTVIIGVVEHDVHDIGKNIVRLMIEASGFRVVDLGRGVPGRKFLEAALAEQNPIVALSTLMTTTMKYMSATTELLHRELPGIRVMVGGAPVSSGWAAASGADFYGANAREAVIGVHKLAEIPLPL